MHSHFTMTFPSFHFTTLMHPSHHHSFLPFTFTSPHLTSPNLTSPNFTSLHFWWFPPHLHFALFIAFLTLFLKLLGLQERVPKTSARSWFLCSKVTPSTGHFTNLTLHTEEMVLLMALKTHIGKNPVRTWTQLLTTIFWDARPNSLVDALRSFGGQYIPKYRNLLSLCYKNRRSNRHRLKGFFLLSQNSQENAETIR
jgi:hypothetical protein